MRWPWLEPRGPGRPTRLRTNPTGWPFPKPPTGLPAQVWGKAVNLPYFIPCTKKAAYLGSAQHPWLPLNTGTNPSHQAPSLENLALAEHSKPRSNEVACWYKTGHPEEGQGAYGKSLARGGHPRVLVKGSQHPMPRYRTTKFISIALYLAPYRSE